MDEISYPVFPSQWVSKQDSKPGSLTSESILLAMMMSVNLPNQDLFPCLVEWGLLREIRWQGCNFLCICIISVTFGKHLSSLTVDKLLCKMWESFTCLSCIMASFVIFCKGLVLKIMWIFYYVMHWKILRIWNIRRAQLLK